MVDEPTPPKEEEEEVQPEPTPPEEEPKEEPTPEQPEAPEETPEEPPEEEETPPEEEKPPSRREQLRIQTLLKKYGPPGSRPPAPLQTDGEDWLDGYDLEAADPEVVKQLRADRQRAEQAQYNEGLKRAEFLDWKTSLKIDAPTIEKKYPILDKDSPEFNPAAADAINTWYLNMSGFDPQTQTVTNSNIGYSDFVEGFFELVQETAGAENAQTVKRVAKQAATTGLRPDGSSAKKLNLNKAPQEMTMEELYASIGQTPPKK